MENNKLEKATRILAKLCEIAHWTGAVAMVVGFILLLVFGEKAVKLGDDFGGELTVYGSRVEAFDENGALDLTALKVFTISASIPLALMALVFRNVVGILKISESGSPFCDGSVKSMRNIGWYLIGVAASGLVMGVVGQLLTNGRVELSADMSYVVMGLLALCLSRFFARGTALEDDVGGLL